MRTLLCLALAGCSLYYTDKHDDDPPIGDPPIDLPACPEITYAAPTTITTASELAAKIEGTPEWVAFTEYTTGCLYASEDITITGTITVDGTTLAVPGVCPDCETGATFMLRDAPANVECIDPEYFWDFVTCDAITATDTTVRLRTVMRDIHPAYPNYLHIVEVLPGADTPCGSEQYTCGATKACWNSARDFCAYCLDGTNEQCACWEGSKFMTDGTRCTMMVSGDVQVSGTCEAGVCETQF